MIMMMKAFEIWSKHIDPSRILRFGDKDNFGQWEIQGLVVLVVKFSMTKVKNILMVRRLYGWRWR